MKTNPRATLDKDLELLRADLTRLVALLEQAIDRSLQALAQRDQALARQVIAEDAVINALRFKIEEFCLALIATQQPAAGDLRAIVAGMSIVVDLERMADHAAGIAKTVLRMGDEPLLKELIDIPRMVELCKAMIRKSLQAYLTGDAELAAAVAQEDDSIDALYNQVFRELLSFMVEDPKTTTRALYLLFTAHNLERIGDRATNIAERVIFMTSGVMKELNPEPPESLDLE